MLRRLRHRAEEDLNLTRVCIALRRQRKPVRRHMHRIILLRHLKNIRPIVEQVVSRLEPLRPEVGGVDEDVYDDDTEDGYEYGSRPSLHSLYQFPPAEGAARSGPTI